MSKEGDSKNLEPVVLGAAGSKEIWPGGSPWEFTGHGFLKSEGLFLVEFAVIFLNKILAVDQQPAFMS
jgi:hypothetical protein